MPAETYNLHAIRDLLEDVFTYRVFVIFCFDQYQSVYRNLTKGMGRLVAFQLLVDHCHRIEILPDLLEQLQAIDPAQYDQHLREINTPAPPEPEEVPSDVQAREEPGRRSRLELTFPLDLSHLTEQRREIAIDAAIGALAAAVGIAPTIATSSGPGILTDQGNRPNTPSHLTGESSL